ncbi:MAG: response regulator, partial [Pseudohongiellaceae bacterium]
MDIIPDEEFDNYLYIGESLDDSGTLKVLESLLCFKGGKIYQARNDHYAEARAILENRNIKVLLIDQYLNSGNGIDLMLTMQEFASVATIVVVMSDLSIDIIVALEAGATDAVYAGINPRELAARIHVAGRNGYRNSTGHLQSAHSKAAQEHNKSRLPVYYIES